MRTVSLKLPSDLDAKVDIIAKRRGQPRSEVIREAIAAFEPEHVPSFTDLAGDLVGCLQGGPSDLSCNPERLEGYGT